MIFSGGFYFPEGEEHFLKLGDEVASYQEPQRLKAFEYVRSWDRAADLGAHVGLFSAHFAKRFKEVMAFEPMPSTRDCLKRNVPDNVKILPFACGDAERSVTMRRHVLNSGGSEVLWSEERAAKVKDKFDVQMVTLDSLNLEKLDLIKIDIQGSEPAALRGAEQTLRRCKPVVLLEEKPIGGQQGSREHIVECEELMARFGYIQKELIGADRVYIRPECS